MKESILISGILIFIYIFLFINRNNIIYVESKSGLKFLVHKDEYQKEKANLLGDVVEKMLKLKNHLVINKNNINGYTRYIEQLNENFTQSRTVIYETDPSSDLTSYSVNKGEELSVCLKSKKTGELHQINLLMYVVIHEMAHFGCPSIGHGDEFKKIFKKFLEEAIKIGVYTKEHYESNPVEYCGMILSSSIV
jgi:predicted metal-dependent hydrolase